jgi:hypothetical protein
VPRVLLSVLIVVVAAAAAWFFFLHDEGDTPPAPVLPKAEAPTPEKAPPQESTAPPVLQQRPKLPPDVHPAMTQIAKPANALLVARFRTSWPALMEMGLRGMRKLSYRTWYMEGEGQPSSTGRGMAKLTDKPTGDYLDEQNVAALVLDAVDPNVFPMSFWEVVARRVHAGTMGLWFRPGPPIGEGDVAPIRHPALTHPILKDLLPIARTAEFQGDPVPGSYSVPQLLHVTDAGTRHPATRLVDDPASSAKVWQLGTMEKDTFATSFCYPVLEVKPGAQTLVVVQAATDVPAIVVSSPKVGRVLWMGNVDYGQKTYYNEKTDALQKIAFNQQLVWILGQAAPPRKH